MLLVTVGWSYEDQKVAEARPGGSQGVWYNRG